MRIVIAQLLPLLLLTATALAERTGPFYLQSENQRDLHVGYNFKDQAMRLQDRGKRFWFHSPGLSGEEGSVSLESVDLPGYFLRHYRYQLEMEMEESARNPMQFKSDATFYLRVNHFTKGFLALESVNNPGHFLRHAFFLIRLDKEEDTVIFRGDASFRFVEGPVFLQSRHHSALMLGIDNHYQAIMTEHGSEIYAVTPGLTGEPNTVSFEMKKKNGHYLRAFGTFLNFESHVAPIRADEYDREATFYRRENLLRPGYHSFESMVHPGRYIRQTDYRLRVMANDGSELFTKDGSFRTLYGPVKLEAYDNHGQFLVVDEKDQVVVAPNGTSFNVVYPGLSGQAGSSSLEVVGKPHYYVRESGAGLQMNFYDHGALNDAFRKDATFQLREQVFCEGDNIMSFESIEKPAHFMHYEGANVDVAKFEATPTFEEHVSFRAQEGVLSFPPEKKRGSSQSSSGSASAGAVVGAIFGGVILGVLVTGVTLVLADKFYFKRVLTDAPEPPRAFENPAYSARKDQVEMKDGSAEPAATETA